MAMTMEEQTTAPEYLVAPPETYGGIDDFFTALEQTCSEHPGGLSAMCVAVPELGSHLTPLRVLRQSHIQLNKPAEDLLPPRIQFLAIQAQELVQIRLSTQNETASSSTWERVRSLAMSMKSRLNF